MLISPYPFCDSLITCWSQGSMVTENVGRHMQSATIFSSLIYSTSITYSVIIDKYLCCLSDFIGEVCCLFLLFLNARDISLWSENKMTFPPSICSLKCKTAWYGAKSSFSKVKYLLCFSNRFFCEFQWEMDHHLLSEAVLHLPQNYSYLQLDGTVRHLDQGLSKARMSFMVKNVLLSARSSFSIFAAGLCLMAPGF